MEEIKFDKLSSCPGCGAKVGAGMLAEILSGIPTRHDPDLLVGFDTSDDAAVYRISDDLALVQTVDFFPSMVKDPRLFGQIAAANALSDIYAMGGVPKIAMNLLCLPKGADKELAHAILAGGYEKIYEAGAVVAGGHSIYDEEAKYGLAVTGFVRPDRFLRNNTPRPGDILFLTKPLGVGVLCSAAAGDLVDEEVLTRLYRQMATLNKYAAEAVASLEVHSCTDVTGFGLLGHLSELCAGGVTAEIDPAKVPLIDPCVAEFAAMGLLPEGLYRNRRYAQPFVENEDQISRVLADLLYDPQTSGGLLLSVAPEDAPAAQAALEKASPGSRSIGTVTQGGTHRIRFVGESTCKSV